MAISNGTWDVKRVLGQAKIYDDGSAWAFIYGFAVTLAIGFLAWLPVRSDT